MRVLHVCRTYFPDSQGGIEEVIRQTCSNTGQLGVESRVFTLSVNPNPSVLVWEGIEVHRFKRTFELASCGVSVTALTGFKSLVEWADIIHYHFPWPFADFLHFFGKVRKSSLLTYHSDVIRQKLLLRLYQPLMNAFLQSVDVVVPTSENYSATSRELGRYAEKVEMIPIGISQAGYPRVVQSELDSMRAKVGDGFVLFVGVLRYYKGLHILLEALQGTSLKCVIAGSGPVEVDLKRQMSELNLEENLTFMGQVSNEEKVQLIHLCKAVVFPSHLRSEAFGVTLVEGAMFGKPLISTELGTGTSYINQDGETGYVVPPSNVKAFREAMLKLEADDKLAKRMGDNARKRYEQLFTGERMGKLYTQLYTRLLKRADNHD